MPVLSVLGRVGAAAAVVVRARYHSPGAVTVKGAKGALTLGLVPGISVAQEQQNVVVQLAGANSTALVATAGATRAPRWRCARRITSWSGVCRSGRRSGAGSWKRS